MTKINEKLKAVKSYKAIMRRGLNENVRKEKFKQYTGKGLKVSGSC